MPISKLKASSIASGTLDNARIPSLAASKIGSGTFDDARIAASNVSQHATSFDDNKLVNDLSTLGLRVHTQENLTASSTNSQYIDVFQDSRGYTNGANTTRNASEYISTISTTTGTPNTTADDILLLESYGHSNNEDNFVDASTGGVGQTSIGHEGNVYYSDSQSLSGVSCSIYSGGASTDAMYNSTNSPDSTAFQNLPSNTDYTVEFWLYPRSDENYGTNQDSVLDIGQIQQWEYDSSENLRVYNAHTGNNLSLGSVTKNQWNDLALVKDCSTTYVYKNGTAIESGTSRTTNFTDNFIRIMYHRNDNSRRFRGWMDLLRITKRAVYPSGTSFTPANVWNYTVETANATGNFVCTNITAASATTKMGAVITYQDQSGTNALNTDIVLQLSADGGSNYSTATLTALPDFSTGIKMAKVNDLAVTSGTSLKYKILFANQASGSKEARIRGVSLNY